MTIKLSRILILSLMLVPWISHADFQKSLKKAGLKSTDTAAVFWGDKGVEEISWRADQAMKPASLTKIATAAYAMSELALDFKWTSELRSTANIKAGVLKGDLCFYGGGNPSFLTEHLWVLSNHFLRSGIRKIEGDLIIDESYFDSEYFDDKRMKKRVLRSYDAPVSGASFNWNSVNIYTRPGNVVGSPSKIFTSPSSDYIKIINKLTTSSSKKAFINISREEKAGMEVFTVSGRIPVSSQERVFYRPIRKPTLWTGYNIKAVFEKLGIEISSKPRKGRCSSNAKVLASVKSKDFSLVIRDLMKFSNNFIAESLAKTVVKANKKQMGNMDQALDSLNKFLTKKGSKKHEIYSVSGLSYQNLMTADLIAKILKDQQEDFRIFPEFIASFPISNLDGTLKSRFKTNNMASKVRAKTGLLNKVVGLAGYGQTKSRKEFGFVLIYNASDSIESWKVRNSFDRLVTEYAKNN